jgi:hypothetical protein
MIQIRNFVIEAKQSVSVYGRRSGKLTEANVQYING